MARQGLAGRGWARLGKAWQGMAWHGLARLGLAWRGGAWHGVAGQGRARLGMARRGGAWLGEAGQGKAGRGLAWRGEAGHGKARRGGAWHGKARRGGAWRGVARQGKARRGEARINIQLNQNRRIKMANLKDAAKAYEGQTKNIADLPKVSTELEVEERSGTNDEGKDFSYKVVIVDGVEYRVPVSVLKSLKTILEDNPDIKSFKVRKTGTGMGTSYTVIPLN